MEEFDKKVTRELQTLLQPVGFKEEERERVMTALDQSHERRSKRTNRRSWAVAAAAVMLTLFLSIPFFNQDDQSSAPASAIDTEAIELKVLEEKQLSTTEKEYIVQVINQSPHVIKHASLFVSYDIKVDNGVASNPFKQRIELINELPSGETYTTSTIVRTDLFKGELINSDAITLDLMGYVHTVSPESMFHLHQSNSSISGDGEID